MAGGSGRGRRPMVARGLKLMSLPADRGAMRRLANRGWLLGLGLLILVLAVTRVLMTADHDRRAALERAARRQATTLLQQAVDDSLAREVALARVLSVSPEPTAA